MVNDLNRIRDSFDKIVEEAEAIVSVTEVPTFKEIEAEQTGNGLPAIRKRKRKTFFDEQNDFDDVSETFSLEEKFKWDVFYCLIDSLLLNLKDRYRAVCEINDLFKVL